MTEQEVKLIVGGLLHDIGKVIYRTGDGRKHSLSGYDFLKEELHIQDVDILESVRYHHSDALRSAELSKNSFAYITYISDNIASGADRRKKEAEDYGFEMTAPLQPVFNILNGNHKELYYVPMMLEDQINYPTENKCEFDEAFYNQVKLQLKDTLSGIEINEKFVNSLLEVLEATLAFVPSSTAKGEVADISLFDHVKMTAAINSCIYQYLQEQGIEDYHDSLYMNATAFYDKKAFLLYEIDISGIQSFIYTIHTRDALKMLRSRSFYLEIMLENIVDNILELLHISRANLIYSGGGHCYLLLPNTNHTKQVLDQYDQELNQWLVDTFDISLFAATAYVEASANTLKNIPESSYAEMFHKLSELLGKRKTHRYSAADIQKLNHCEREDYTRECRVCKHMGHIGKDDLCDFCQRLKKASTAIMYQPFFVIQKDDSEYALPLPGNQYMVAETEEQVKARLGDNSDHVIRVYSKNKYYTGLNIATKIWVGNYTKGQTFEELADSSEGIHRLGVLRADVDNLGQTFRNGFESTYATLSRTATLSRQLSMFFKYYINSLLEKKDRNVTIVYSGGDDMFIVGAWNELIDAAIDIRDAFIRYSEHTLTLSAGFGIYDSGYPISQMAVEVGGFEDKSKRMEGKDAITLLPDVYRTEENAYLIDDGTYHWDTLKQCVLGEKYQLLEHFFKNMDERGNGFLYHLLELIRDRSETINFARYVYLLARMEPSTDAPQEQKELYRNFSRQMYEWMQTAEDCRQLKTAINIYAHKKRESEVE